MSSMIICDSWNIHDNPWLIDTMPSHRLTSWISCEDPTRIPGFPARNPTRIFQDHGRLSGKSRIPTRKSMDNFPEFVEISRMQSQIFQNFSGFSRIFSFGSASANHFRLSRIKIEGQTITNCQTWWKLESWTKFPALTFSERKSNSVYRYINEIFLATNIAQRNTSTFLNMCFFESGTSKC